MQQKETSGPRLNSVFVLRMPEDLTVRLDQAAKGQYETASSLARRLVREGLEEIERANARQVDHRLAV